MMARGATAAEAYREAGYKSKNVKQNATNASRMARRPLMKARISELKAILEEMKALPPPASEVRQARVFGSSPISMARWVSKDWVLNTLIEVVNRTMQASPIRDPQGNVIMVEVPPDVNGNQPLDPEGKPIISAMLSSFKAKEATRAAELIGKQLGMFVERVDATYRTAERLRAMTPEQRMADAAELAARIRNRIEELREQEAGEVVEGESRDVTSGSREDDGSDNTGGIGNG